MIEETFTTVPLVNSATTARAWLEKVATAVRPEVTTVLVLLLLLQYAGVIRNAFSALGSLRSIPLTIVFLVVLSTVFLLSRSSFREKTAMLFRLVTVPIVLLWVLTTSWAFLFGSLIAFPTPALGVAILVITAALVAAGLVTKRLWLICVTLAAFSAAVTYFHIQANDFLSTFLPGRPLWVIQSAVLNLGAGNWPYVYDDYHSLSYFPFLALPYVPFGWLRVDLRWANFAGAVLLISTLWFVGRKEWRLQRVIALVAVFLSPMFLYALITTQLSFYWVYLLCMILAASYARLSAQRSTFLLASLSRQLAWPLVLPWIIYWAGRNGREKKEGQRRSIDWSFLRMRPWDVLGILIVLGIFLANPKAFYWGTFVYALNDGYSAAAGGTVQAARSIALTPLLPFATNPGLVFLTGAVIVTVVTAWLARTQFLFKSLPQSLIIIYACVLSFGFVVHDYYWIDVVIMTLGYIWATTGTGNQTATTS